MDLLVRVRSLGACGSNSSYSRFRLVRPVRQVSKKRHGFCCQSLSQPCCDARRLPRGHDAIYYVSILPQICTANLSPARLVLLLLSLIFFFFFPFPFLKSYFLFPVRFSLAIVKTASPRAGEVRDPRLLLVCSGWPAPTIVG